MNFELIMIGTGSAFPKHSYNSCYAIKSPGGLMLVDAGGGNGVFNAINDAGIKLADIHHIFITHSHTDHILGAVWLVRGIINMNKDGEYYGGLRIYGNSSVCNALRLICELTFLASDYDRFTKNVELVEIADEYTLNINDTCIECLDVCSKNVVQTGFRMTFGCGEKLVCLGDESLTEDNLKKIKGCDTLICGAFCRYEDKEIYKPYEKHHHTVRDVAILAEKAKVKNLVLVHSEDDNLENRQNLYRAEASKYYSGNVFIPVDGESLVF